MPHVVEDYYDMPIELLPSANFAGRPTSDIDMLAGLWATAASYYSNFSSSEDEADVNGHDDNDRDDKVSPQRIDECRVSPPPPTETKSREERPSTTITLPPADDIRASSGVVRGLARAQLRRKANSAPYGSLESRASPLVEAVEAVGEGRVGGVGGLGYFDTIRRKYSNNREKEGEQRRKKRVRSCDVNTSKEKRRMMGELLADAQAQGSGAAISPSAKQSCTSLAQQTRVGPKRQGRQLATLDTDVAGYELSSIRGRDTTTATTVAGSPSSVLSTPQELYAIGKGHAANETLGSPQVWYARNGNPANIMVMADKMCSPSSPSNRRWGGNSTTITHSDTVTQHRRSSVDVAGGRIIYVPGTMMLAREPVRQRRDSVATALDACTFDGTKLASEEKRYAELVGLEEDVVTFFEELGVVAEATEASLDRYWLCNGRCSASVEKEGHDDKASLSSTASVSVGEAESNKGQGKGSRASRFSFSSSASSCSAPVSTHRHRRKRSRLIELLLSPGMPGAVSVNAPAS
ncbi:hypothetical protein COCMIDRAFT_89581 [Bipolaris oryzae ATCC 44560]|uniref:Uncharacterized protein n=1 Tax=Bipolaris oryzae ATCC 44560 TaxID=930090 RepID=W6Z7D6_COCMI|nr:uncharacterized protein COCMIDRAFT_89581 [Bipolaris oryzae ATCC 44560]EUC47642.1 hypothetical protein COCMIDRAFT_89581 [Bipolaris oryzae ATCC 44560]